MFPDDEGDLDGDEDENGGKSSAITIQISTGIRVSGDDNLIFLAPSFGDSASSPAAEHARSIAETVTTAIRRGGEQGSGGIPMIDEEGRPRAIRVQVEAGMEVHGKGNVLLSNGSGKRMLDRVLMDKFGLGERSRQSRKRRRQQQEEEVEEEEGKEEVEDDEEEEDNAPRPPQRRRIAPLPANRSWARRASF